MKEHWFEFIEYKEREARYLEALVLDASINIKNYKDGPGNFKRCLNEYYGALFPWLENPAEVERTKNAAMVKSMEAEMEHLTKTHTFESKKVDDIIVISLPSYMIGPSAG